MIFIKIGIINVCAGLLLAYTFSNEPTILLSVVIPGMLIITGMACGLTVLIYILSDT